MQKLHIVYLTVVASSYLPSFIPFLGGRNSTLNPCCDQPASSISNAPVDLVSRSLTDVYDIQSLEQNAIDQLDWIYSRLKHYVFQTSFDYLGFGEVAQDLESKLAKTKRVAELVELQSHPLASRLAFVDHVFSVMKHAMHGIIFYRKKNNLGRAIVVKLIELKVKLLFLFDSCGIPRKMDAEYSSVIKRSEILVAAWEDLFSSIQSKTISVELMFENQIFEIRQVLEVLKNSKNWQKRS